MFRYSLDITKHFYAGGLRIASNLDNYQYRIGMDSPPEGPETFMTTTSSAPGWGSAQISPNHIINPAPRNDIALDDLIGIIDSLDLDLSLAALKSQSLQTLLAPDFYDRPSCFDDFDVDNPAGYQHSPLPGQTLLDSYDCICRYEPSLAHLYDLECDAVTDLYWYHPDYLGNTEFITDIAGQPFQFFVYSPFGETLLTQHAASGRFNTPHRFNAKELDPETGLYYYGARYYNPEVHVWLSVDPMHAFRSWVTPYNFVQNNPVMLVDPTGMLDGDPQGPQQGPSGSGGWHPPYLMAESSTSGGNGGSGSGGTTVDFGFQNWMLNTSLGGSPSTQQGQNNSGSQRSASKSNQQLSNNIKWKIAAYFLRNSERIGNQANVFYGAEAIFFDAGVTIAGMELDVGQFFILTGKEMGTFVPYYERAGGFGTSFDFGGELGRVDISGNPSDFDSSYLFGVRDKIWLSGSAYIISLGGAYSWGEHNGRRVIGRSVQLSVGLSVFGFLSGGYNFGEIIRR